LLLPVLLCSAESGKTCLTEPRYDSTLMASLRTMYHGDYAAADSLLLAGVPARAPAQAYFRGLILCNRFSDLGDTAALARAASLWESLVAADTVKSDSQAALYVGLAELQLSYLASLRGHTLRAATLGRKANRR